MTEKESARLLRWNIENPDRQISQDIVNMTLKRESVEAEVSSDDFVILKEGLFNAIVCSRLPQNQVEERMARIPCGTTSGWTLEDEPLPEGMPNPATCNEKPETHKHYLFAA